MRVEREKGMGWGEMGRYDVGWTEVDDGYAFLKDNGGRYSRYAFLKYSFAWTS